MVIDDLDVERFAVPPAKADSPLVIDSNAPLARAASRKSLEPIGWRNSQVAEVGSTVEHPQLTQRDLLDVSRKPTSTPPLENRPSFFLLERADHSS